MKEKSKLRLARERRGMTQIELADKSGVSRPTIANIESGVQKNTLTGTLIKLADALSIDVQEII